MDPPVLVWRVSCCALPGLEVSNSSGDGHLLGVEISPLFLWPKNQGENCCEVKPRVTDRWWQLKHFLIFTPNFGEDETNLTHIFSNGLKPPTSIN